MGYPSSEPRRYPAFRTSAANDAAPRFVMRSQSGAPYSKQAPPGRCSRPWKRPPHPSVAVGSRKDRHLKLVAELGSDTVSETEVARIERDDLAVAETVGLTLDEGKRLTASTHAEIVRAQVAAAMGERFRWCEPCRAKLLSKGYYPATFHSVFGDVIPVGRLR
jgi:hypothetical protein